MDLLRPECNVTRDVINKHTKGGKKGNLLWFLPNDQAGQGREKDRKNTDAFCGI